jgi:hypothetical protein
MSPQQDNDFMDVDSDSDASMLGGSSRTKGKGKGKTLGKRKDKGKAKANDVRVLLDLKKASNKSVAAIHLGGIIHTYLGSCSRRRVW